MRHYFNCFYCSILMLLVADNVSGKEALPGQAGKYYRFKNRAELAIMQGRYDTALVAYKNAFSIKFPNERDIYNAFHIAYILGDSAASKEYLGVIFLHGQEKGKYELTPFGKLIVNEDFYKWCSQGYDSLHVVASNSRMRALAAMLDSVYTRDQAIRKQSKERLYRGEKVDLRSTDSINLVEIEKFIEQYGFPNYELVGIFEQCKGGYAGGFSTIDLLLWHTRHSLRTLNGTLEKAAREGLLPPEEYTFYMDAQDGRNLYCSILPKNAQNGAVSIDSLIDVDSVDKRRQSAMACTLSEYYCKFRYQEDTKDGRFQFFFLPLFARFANALPPGAEF